MKIAEQATESLLQEGMDAFTGGRLADAELSFLRLVGVRPDHAPSYNLLARICLRQSRIDEAEHYVALALMHGGTFLVTSEAELDAALAENARVGNRNIYAIEFRTEEFEPGVFRKIRCALIDGEVHLVHVDFSPNWNVHRTRSDQAEIEFMKASPHLMEQEHAFLRDPEGCLGETNMRRLHDLARVMELDFVGLDFNILSSGELVIFEQNAAMSTIIPHKVKHFPYFADYRQRIEVAVENMILRKAGKM